MRPTKALGDASGPPTTDPATSLLLILAIIASFVAIGYPLATAGVLTAVAAGAVLRRSVSLSDEGYLCVPKLDRCYRVVPV